MSGYLNRLASELSEQFAGSFGQETVERYVLESYAALLRTATVKAHLANRVTRFATDRLTALAQAIAAEVLAAGVRVNVVLPSTIDTEANRRAMPDADTSRWVTTDSLGDVISFLLSARARDVSGAALPVYGRVNV